MPHFTGGMRDTKVEPEARNYASRDRSTYRAATVKERYAKPTLTGELPWVRPAPRRRSGSIPVHSDPSTTSRCFRGAPNAFDPVHRSPDGSSCGSRTTWLLAFHRDSLGIDFRQPAAPHIVAPVDRTGFLAVQVRPVAREGNEISHSRRAVTAPSQSRLCFTHPYARIGSFGT